MSAISDALAAEYDLRYRPAPGERFFYQLDIVYRSLAEDGLRRLENYRGIFDRAVEGVSQDGRAQETITWRRVGRREAAGTSGYGPWEYPEFAQNLSYPFSAEDDYNEFHWQYDALPRDDATWLTSWNVVLLTVDTHFEFDFLRSTRHGGIERLRRVGDSVICPDASHTFWLGLPPVVDVPAFSKPNLQLRFAGLSRRGGHDCGLLEFSMGPNQFEMLTAGQRQQMSSSFRGTISVRLADGSLQHGEFDEYVLNPAGCTSPRYEITRLDNPEWDPS